MTLLWNYIWQPHLSTVSSWRLSREIAAGENPLIWTALRPGARQWLGFGPGLQPEEELRLLQMIRLTVSRQSSQHRMGEDTPGGLQQPRGFKDSGCAPTLWPPPPSSSWSTGPSSTADTWSMRPLRPRVWRCCSGRWRQQEGDRRSSGLADGSGSKKQLSCQSMSLLAFTKGGNTFTLLTVMECCLMSVIQFLLKEALSNPWL